MYPVFMIYDQIICKQRVADHGEVFTAPREVNAMLDLVQSESKRIDARFLEPACGKGAFITQVLHRKLATVARRYAKSPSEYERYAVLAVSSIYGIDILQDNVADCRQVMADIFREEYKTALKTNCPPECINTVRFILHKNIIWGDALTLKRMDAPEPIVFSEWSFVTGNMIKRKDYVFSHILNCSTEGLPLLNINDKGEKVWSPRPVKEYPATPYLRLADADEL